ncbi:MAG: alpha/beta fold hydrolase [Culicoidibacterales bacterium]
MIQKICNTDIHYTVAGAGKNIILLHGWGQNIEMMEPVGQHLQKWFRVWNIDLPGFSGASVEPPFAWDIYDYSSMLAAFIAELGIINPTLIGHSFGGRMAIIYAAKHLDVHKVILLDAAGIRPKRSFDYYRRVYAYKTVKTLLKITGLTKISEAKLKNAGSTDYQQSSQLMKQIMTKVVNEDLTYLLKDIKAPTLLVWGELDDATPVSDGEIMEELIPNAGLVIFKNAGHYAYLECLPQLQRVLESFLSKEIEQNNRSRKEDKSE